MRVAAKYGSLCNMKWLLENGCPIDDSHIFVSAVEYGSLDILKWLLDKKCPIYNPLIMGKTAKCGSLVNLNWLLENGGSIDHPAIFCDALHGGGSLRVLKSLLENKCPVGEVGRSNAEEMFGSCDDYAHL